MQEHAVSQCLVDAQRGLDRLEKVMKGLDPDAAEDEIVGDSNELESPTSPEYDMDYGRDQSRHY